MVFLKMVIPLGLYLAVEAGCQRAAVVDAGGNGGGREEPSAVAEPLASEPAAAGPSEAEAPEEQPKADDRPRITLEDLEALREADTTDRWIHIEGLMEGGEGGWVTGRHVAEDNRLEISTEHVSQFAMNLARVPVNWDRRVVLKIDGHTSELTRKHYPLLRLKRSPTGGWNAVTEAEKGG